MSGTTILERDDESVSSRSGHDASGGMSSTTQWGDEEAQKKKGAKKKSVVIGKEGDNQSVYVSMAIVLGMIAVTAAIVIGLTYTFLNDAQEEDFKHGVSSVLVWS